MTTFNKMLTSLSQASYVTLGYGQVEPNHLSAQRTGQIYAQLPANGEIELLENGQFVKYDYAKGEVNFTGAGEWMLVFNEIKLYRDGQRDCEFAMKKGNYIARIYSPVAHVDGLDQATIATRYYGGKDANGETIEKVTAPADMYELHATEDPFHIVSRQTEPAKMADVNALVPRVFKTNVGDIYTTNMVNITDEALKNFAETPVILKVNTSNGILDINGNDDSGMEWQVVKVYTLPDTQKAVKLMRIK